MGEDDGRLFDDGEAARQARDEAMERVEVNADEEWKREARRAWWEAIKLVGYQGELTTDDADCSTPREPRAWGPIVKASAIAGVIENTGRTRISTSVRCHARPKTLWRVTYRFDQNGRA